ncbi:class I SAM-dependent methyltransferase [Thalassolituus sp.]|uniref:class I SAM-dependent methyltransferase n=1 Tax=Thalassolituus sp. TaxID=2030822 RepID=UPI003518DBCD
MIKRITYGTTTALVSLTLALSLGGCLPQEVDEVVETGEVTDATPATVSKPTRHPDELLRDQYRHPAETLMFFDVQPSHTVVEIWPGAGWYSAILAPYLKDEGQLIAAHFPADSEVSFFRKSRAAYNERFLLQPDLYGKIFISELAPPQVLNIAEAGEADRVLTFRNVHNWMRNRQEQVVFDEAYRVLKQGGLLGVVEHRAPESFTREEMVQSGYVSESYVTQLAINAGFLPDGQSEINANPNDRHDHPHGVWSLPPTLRGGESTRAQFETIGESDRMTLRFRKP